MFERRIHTILVFSTLCSIAFAQIGDRCILKFTGDDGICKTSSDCPVVVQLEKKGIKPTVCGYHQSGTLVCCPTDSSYAGPDSVVFPDHVSVSRPSSNDKLRISEQKCEEYNQPLTEIVQGIPLIPHSKPINVNVEKCDYNKVPLIVGGEPALVGEFPFMAAIGFETAEKKWRCGGTLISDRYVLTAAHCTLSRDAGKPKFIRLGDLDLSTSADGSEEMDYRVANAIVHPGYSYPLKYNDIALLQTDRQIVFTKFIRPACLYTKTAISENTATATGWGRVDVAGEHSDRLRKVTLKIYNNSQCTRTYKTHKDLPRGIASSMLCAGELRGRKDTCQGDSGGPLLVTQHENQCKFYVVGITSFGKSCGHMNTPAVYTKVSEYVDWIEQSIW